MLVVRKLLFVAIICSYERGSDGEQIDVAIKRSVLIAMST